MDYGPGTLHTVHVAWLRHSPFNIYKRETLTYALAESCEHTLRAPPPLPQVGPSQCIRERGHKGWIWIKHITMFVVKGEGQNVICQY